MLFSANKTAIAPTRARVKSRGSRVKTRTSSNDPDGESREKDRHIADGRKPPRKARSPKISMKHKMGSINAAACSGGMTSENSGNRHSAKRVPEFQSWKMPVKRTTGIAIA
jgi:hypothetical protein